MIVDIEIIMNVIMIMIVFIGAGAVICMVIGTPFCRYAAFIAKADTDEGEEQFAKHLARRDGRRVGDVDTDWQSFLPTARTLHQSHVLKRTQIDL